ncbi:hypothetical protein V5N11_007195 [Cardamine amara subsp. amara]|uniref:FAF domain-containing protein n=1 Tax=Cardamine amara subsp. amara TaxID=228776 RepID=A0ABD0ZSS5_CARAN
MLIMTSSSTVLTGEEDRLPEDDTPTHSHRQRLSTTVDPGNESLQSFTVRSVEIKSDHENLESREHGVNLDEFFSCSSDNRYSFYLGEKISPWGPSGPPLLKESRSNAPSPQRRGRSVTRKQYMPPFMTTLDCNGRPRFQHRRVRSEGRLEIASVAVDSPEMVSVRGREGLRIGTVRKSQQEEDDDDQRNH